ncbi:MAG: TonB-dependent receptor [Verrucomicrobia bacterium]|jgi:hypothetical protein|nr:TonB-dependent receptor [Verrucomicrobiota bacterium]
MGNLKNKAKDTHQKALEINLDRDKYGTLAEIGGGQEVARWFFRVGSASGTVAKTMSAYDMTVSDSIYGVCKRYVSRQRVETMLEHEYRLLQERLGKSRGSKTQFFAFADTVTTRNASRNHNGHGWLGIRFQAAPNAQPSQIVIHLQLWGKEYIQDQETLGAFGINLIYGAYEHHDQPEKFIESLGDSIPKDHMEVDVIEFTGPAFKKVDNRLMSLKLVETGLANAAIFNPQGAMIEPSELFYKKSVMIQRGSFRPVTKLAMDMLEGSMAEFIQEPKVESKEVVTLLEMSLQNLTTTNEDKKIDPKDFLERVDCLSALGFPVAISNYGEFYRLAAYLFRYTQKTIGITMGVPTLKEVFNEKYYEDLAGGILESFGRLFKNDLKLYVYPWKEPSTGALITATNLLVEPHLRHLYQYLYENQFIQSLRDFDSECLGISSHKAFQRIKEGDGKWRSMVPEKVAALITERKLFMDRNEAGNASL